MNPVPSYILNYVVPRIVERLKKQPPAKPATTLPSVSPNPYGVQAPPQPISVDDILTAQRARQTALDGIVGVASPTPAPSPAALPSLSTSEVNEVLNVQQQVAPQHIQPFKLEDYKPGMIPALVPQERQVISDAGSVTATENSYRVVPPQPVKTQQTVQSQLRQQTPTVAQRISTKAGVRRGSGAYFPVSEIAQMRRKRLPEAEILRRIQDAVAAQIGLTPEDVYKLTQRYGQHPLANIVEPGSDSRSSLESIFRQGISAGGRAEFKITPELVALLDQDKRSSFLSPTRAAVQQIQDQEWKEHQEWLDSIAGKTQQLAAGIGHGGSLGHFAGSAMEHGNPYAEAGNFIGDLGTRSLLQVGGALTGGLPGGVAAAMLPALVRANTEGEIEYDLNSRLKEAAVAGATAAGGNRLMAPFAGGGAVTRGVAGAVAYPASGAVVNSAVTHEAPDPQDAALQAGVGLAMGVVPHLLSRNPRQPQTTALAQRPRVQYSVIENESVAPLGAGRVAVGQRLLAEGEGGLLPGQELFGPPGQPRPSGPSQSLPGAPPRPMLSPAQVRPQMPTEAPLTQLPSSGKITPLDGTVRDIGLHRTRALHDWKATREGRGIFRDDGDGVSITDINSYVSGDYIKNAGVVQLGPTRIFGSPSFSAAVGTLWGKSAVLDGINLSTKQAVELRNDFERVLRFGKQGHKYEVGENLGVNVEWDGTKPEVRTALENIVSTLDKTIASAQGRDIRVVIPSLGDKDQVNQIIGTHYHETAHEVQNWAERTFGKEIDYDALTKSVKKGSRLEADLKEINTYLSQVGYRTPKQHYEEIDARLLGGPSDWKTLGIDPNTREGSKRAFRLLEYVDNALKSTYSTEELTQIDRKRLEVARPGRTRKLLEATQNVRSARTERRTAPQVNAGAKGRKQGGSDQSLLHSERLPARGDRGASKRVDGGRSGRTASSQRRRVDQKKSGRLFLAPKKKPASDTDLEDIGEFTGR